MAYVFLSHAHADKPFARKLAADLRRSGHAVWIDEAEINIGDSLIERITAGLQEVDYVAAILSKTSIESAWVTRELELASNREINERRVVVLPLLIDDVPMPGFLEGKLYGDFRDENGYQDTFELVLRSLGEADPPPQPNAEEVAALKEELKAVRAIAAKEAAAAERAGNAAFAGKSDKLKAAINAANKKFPAHAPINKTYAFEVGSVSITLDYALWAIAKATHRGGHPLDMLLTIEERWGDLENMLEAYEDMVGEQS